MKANTRAWDACWTRSALEVKGQTFLVCQEKAETHCEERTPQPKALDQRHHCVLAMCPKISPVPSQWGQDEKWRLLPDSLASGTWRVMHSLYFSLANASGIPVGARHNGILGTPLHTDAFGSRVDEKVLGLGTATGGGVSESIRATITNTP